LITLSLFLNKILESQYLGFLIVTVLLGIICGVVYMKIKPHLEQPKVVADLERKI
jgi:F0F1-type ATP synthase assembly protein I